MPAPARIGIALGSGSARGWAHIGILRALEAAGIVPEVVCGASIGALVGAAYASNRLDALQEWVLAMNWWEILRLMDPGLGALLEGERLMKTFTERVEDVPIETLPKRFGAVATDLSSGAEVWFRNGSLQAAVRASIAIPGLFRPAWQEGRWLVDGGLVDPVPVALCRALGAERVIAVNLNSDLVGRQWRPRQGRERLSGLLGQLGGRLQNMLLSGLLSARRRPKGSKEAPWLFDVIFGAMYIMQDRITRSRLAGDPPEVVLAPRLGHLALMDFDRGQEAVEAGMECVRLNLPLLQAALQVSSDDQTDQADQAAKSDPPAA